MTKTTMGKNKKSHLKKNVETNNLSTTGERKNVNSGKNIGCLSSGSKVWQFSSMTDSGQKNKPSSSKL